MMSLTYLSSPAVRMLTRGTRIVRHVTASGRGGGRFYAHGSHPFPAPAVLRELQGSPARHPQRLRERP